MIFFLVTTTILNDKGILVKLPPLDTNSPPSKILERNLLNIKINKWDNLLVENKETSLSELKPLVKKFVLNYGKEPSLSTMPSRAVVSLQNDRQSTYAAYLSIYDHLKGAYNEMWDEQAIDIYGFPLNTLTPQQQQIIKIKFRSYFQKPTWFLTKYV